MSFCDLYINSVIAIACKCNGTSIAVIHISNVMVGIFLLTSISINAM